MALVFGAMRLVIGLRPRTGLAAVIGPLMDGAAQGEVAGIKILTEAEFFPRKSRRTVLGVEYFEPFTRHELKTTWLRIQSTAISSLKDFGLEMRKDYRLLFGSVAGVILVFGIAVLAPMIPGYDHVHQTVSEIGEIGSQPEFPFTSCCVALQLASLFSPRPFGRPLSVGCIPYRVHWIVGGGGRTFR